MGKTISTMVLRPFKNYNIENRAHKLISKDKPVPAPRHKSDQEQIDRLQKEYSAAFEESLRKDNQLDKYLKNVYVKAEVAAKVVADTNRPLPQDRAQVDFFDYGVKEPEKAPEGKLTLKQILELLTNYHQDPRKNTPESLAKEYLLPPDATKKLLQYYKIFEIYVPKNASKATFASPGESRVKIVKHISKLLESKDKT